MSRRTPPSRRPRLRPDGGSVRRVLSLGIVFCLAVFSLEATGTLAAWTDSSTVSGTTISTGTLAPPTGITVNQACVADPTPALRSGAGGHSLVTDAGTGTTITIPKPAAAVTGDVLLASIMWAGNYGSGGPTAPPGWTLVRQDGNNPATQFIYTRVVTASEPASYTWTGQAANKAGAVAAFSGVDTSVPVNASSGQVDSNPGSATAPGLTTTRANVLLVGAFGLLNTVNQNAPGGTTIVWNGHTVAGSPGVSTMGVQESRPTAGPTGNRVSNSPGAQTVGQLIALQPPAFPRATTTWTLSTSGYATGQSFTLRAGAVNVRQDPSLAAGTTSQVDSRLTSGTSYTVDLFATFQQWTSTTASRTFTAIGC